jgi:hypothetical protein
VGKSGMLGVTVFKVGGVSQSLRMHAEPRRSGHIPQFRAC